MVFVRALDVAPVAERILLAKKIAIQRENLINADFNRSISQFAEIKPLQALYKPILDSMTGIFQNRKNFKVNNRDGVEFNDDGIIAFVDDLSSKGIRSSIAIAQALSEVAVNGPQVGQPRANYARELAKLFGSANIDEMTTEQIIEGLKYGLTHLPPPDARERGAYTGLPSSEGEEEEDDLDLTSIDAAEPSGAAESTIMDKIVMEDDSDFMDLYEGSSTIPVDAEINPGGKRTKKSYKDIFGKETYLGQYQKEPSARAMTDPLRIYRTGGDSVLFLGQRISPDSFKDGYIRLYGEQVPISDELLQLLKTPASKLSNKKAKDRNTGAIINYAMRKNPRAFNSKDNKTKIKYFEAPWSDPKYFEGEGIGKHKLITAKEAENKFKIMIGQLKAGNNSKILKGELKSISDLLYKHGKLSKESNIKIQQL